MASVTDIKAIEPPSGDATWARRQVGSPAVSGHSQDCPQCGHRMPAVRGSRLAICANCGFKDACCF